MMQEWQKIALELYNGGADYKKIVDWISTFDLIVDTDNEKEIYQKVRRFIYKCQLRHPELIHHDGTSTGTATSEDIACDKAIADNDMKQHVKGTIKKNSDGTTTSERLIKIVEADLKDDRFLLEAHGFAPDVFDIVNATSNFWSMNSTEEERVNCQSKITVKPKVNDGTLTIADIDSYFDNKVFSFNKPQAIPLYYDPNGLELEIDIPDLHAGLFAWRYETGEDYDLKIAIDRMSKAFEDIIGKAIYVPLKKITLVTLGDLLHFDNEEQSTTKGTRQQADGRTAKVHDATIDALVEIIQRLACITNVEVVYLNGNHDFVTGRLLMRAVAQTFKNDKHVEFDLMPNGLKYRMFGKNLVGFTHGDMPSKNMATWLPVIAQGEISNSITKEVHAGHFHSQKNREKVVSVVDNAQTFEDSGITVRYLPTICSASGWEHKSGYTKAMKAIMSFLWHDTQGLKEIWFSN